MIKGFEHYGGKDAIKDRIVILSKDHPRPNFPVCESLGFLFFSYFFKPICHIKYERGISL